MFVCPVCGAEFAKEAAVVKHYLSCWKEHNPAHKTKSAPRNKSEVARSVSPEMEQFFSNLQEGSPNA